MTAFDWPTFLREWSRELLASADIADQLPPEVVASGWLGYPGATEEQLRQAEARLGRQLPPSYRAFLQASNGWRQTGPFIWRLWSTEEVDWFAARNREWIDAYTEPAGDLDPVPDERYFVYDETQDTIDFRPEYLRTALEISDRGDAAIYLLNPEIVTPEGEWEAWFLANWKPGAERYRSFRELMVAQRARFRKLEEMERNPELAPVSPQSQCRCSTLEQLDGDEALAYTQVLGHLVSLGVNPVTWQLTAGEEYYVCVYTARTFVLDYPTGGAGSGPARLRALPSS